MIARTAYEALPEPLVVRLVESGLDPLAVHTLVAAAIEEDLAEGPVADDVTSAATVPAAAQGRGVMAAREAGVVAGLDVAALVFCYVLGEDLAHLSKVPDGARVSGGEAVLHVAGPTRGLLTAERTALNLACHLSGVATAAARWAEALEGTGCRVLDTRKTLPGLRALQKYAVRCGGGTNHRFSLADAAMVKDNHVVAAGGVVPAYEAVRAAYPDLRVHVEVTDLDQLRDLLAAGCESVMLDNMDTATMAEAVRITAGRATLEATGRMSLDRAREVAGTGVDFISVGALTHSVTVLDLGLDLEDDGVRR